MFHSVEMRSSQPKSWAKVWSGEGKYAVGQVQWNLWHRMEKWVRYLPPWQAWMKIILGFPCRSGQFLSLNFATMSSSMLIVLPSLPYTWPCFPWDIKKRMKASLLCWSFLSLSSSFLTSCNDQCKEWAMENSWEAIQTRAPLISILISLSRKQMHEKLQITSAETFDSMTVSKWRASSNLQMFFTSCWDPSLSRKLYGTKYSLLIIRARPRFGLSIL